MRALACLPLAISLLVGCGGDAIAPGETAPTPASVGIISGEGQTGTVGAALRDPLAVAVTGSDGEPMGGVRVTWATDDDGTLEPASETTDASGVVRASWVLGTAAGAQGASASVESLSPVEFTATAEPGPPAQLEKPDGELDDVIAGATIDSARVRIRDMHDNPVPAVMVEWQVTAGGGSVSPASATTDEDGLARTQWTVGSTVGVQNELSAAAEGLEDAPARFSVQSVAATLPLRFADDLVVVSPSVSPEVKVVDAEGRRVPSSALDIEVTEWRMPDGPPSQIVRADATGAIRLEGEFDYGNDWQPFRIRASSDGVAVPKMLFVVGHSWDAERQLFATEYWRWAVPPDWIERAVDTIPDFDRVLDIGWEAQRELMGQSEGEVQSAIAPDTWIPWEVGVETRLEALCGGAGVPIAFNGQSGCMFQAVGDPGHPEWNTIFHELGHNFSLQNFQGSERSWLCPHGHGMLCGPLVWIEAEANLFAIWSYRRLLESDELRASTRESIQSMHDRRMHEYLDGAEGLGVWEEDSRGFTEEIGSTTAVWEGIRLQIALDYGWDYFLRYVRAWRPDPEIGSLLELYDTTPLERTTFSAAAVSAAVKRDLRPEFREKWRFTLDDALFDALYDHLIAAMDQEW